MRSSLIVSLAIATVVNAQGLLNLPAGVGELLATLKPASANDPRFTNFQPAGSGDGMPPRSSHT